jgi:hypothetical protein
VTNRIAVYTGIALAGLAGTFTSAEAASLGLMDCQPHHWVAFATAVELQDNDALRAMLSLPEIHTCDEIYNTIVVLTCADDPTLCPRPRFPFDAVAALVRTDGSAPSSPPEGPFPGQRPGEPLGHEQDRSGSMSPPAGGSSSGK